ncbi:LysR family transcriptional regulator [Lactiplantibacillus plantarum]|uniref:LysR family transcriptional regulator n=1 Tax=Lactiplantibacillus plantarum TaxID=1590 RepID=UPI0014561E87|nr:LysR family transcriptional regulator [Lactiplantibacillus plantarum]NLS61653.1 LysR family transcriptional regulator [Lactiplantibacillus plantarum]
MFQQMQYFIAIVNNHSFTQAAVDCHISQSAISQQMKELESQLGVKLLNRKGRSFEVTEAGQYFYIHSQDILADVDQLIKKTIKIEKNDEVELRVGYLRSFGTAEFLQTVSKFTQEFPKVKIKISSGTHEELYELLQTGKIDLNFSDQRRALSNEYQNEFLTASEFVIAKSYDEAQMLIASNQGYLIINQRMRTQLDKDIVKMISLVKGDRKLIQNYYAYWQANNSGYYIETFAELLKQTFA